MIISQLNTDDEQFVAVSQLRTRMAAFWDEQLRNSSDISSFNRNRAEVLGKFIDMTISR